MMNKTFKVIDEAGIHARPAATLAKEAGKYKSNITLICGEKKGNMKSIMNILAMGITVGSEISIEVDGEDEAVALESIEKVLQEDKVI